MTEPDPAKLTEDTRVSQLAQFIDKALASGVPHDSVVGMLAARGWREKEIYAALGDHCVRTIGLDVPRSRGAGAGARDAFLYLLIFSTLGIWTTELGALAFTFINRWFPDPLYSTYMGFSLETISWSLAAMLIAFPIYLLTSRIVGREAGADPGRLESPIRKWLTYIALLIAALVCVSDLICALAFLIRGEITARFIAKALVVLLLAGGVFVHYYGGLRKSDAASSPRRRNLWVVLLAAAGVTLMAVLGFTQLGPPRTQRELRADSQRVQQLYRVSTNIENHWKTAPSKLPAALSEIEGGAVLDPVNHQPLEYIAGEGSLYQLCTQFNRPSVEDPNATQPDSWKHPAGRYCFQLNASQSIGYPANQFIQ